MSAEIVYFITFNIVGVYNFKQLLCFIISDIINIAMSYSNSDCIIYYVKICLEIKIKFW